MSQAMQVQASPAPAIPPGGAGNVSQPSESNQSFGQVLAGQLETGSSGPASSAPPTAMPGQPPETGESAVASVAGGKVLPPALPPDTESLTLAEILQAGDMPELPAEPVPVVAAEIDVLDSTVDATAMPALPAVVAALVPTAPASHAAGNATGTAGATAALPGNAAAAAQFADFSPTPGQREPVAAELPKAAMSEVAATLRQDNASVPVATTTVPVGMSALATDSSAATATPVRAQIDLPLSHPAWGQTLGNRVVWAMNQNASVAQLHLSPAELGPVSVRISLDQEQASITFSAQHGVVRDAIEAALPRLRDMLGAQGIQLADVNVSAHAFAGRQEPGQSSARRSGNDPVPEDAAPMLSVRQSSGLVDLFA